MLSASEEKLLNMKTVSSQSLLKISLSFHVKQGEERTVDIHTEPIILRMKTVALVKFVGKNITRSGVVAVETKKDVVERAAHRSVTYNTSTDDAIQNFACKVNPLRKEEDPSQHREALKIELQTSEDQNQRDIDFPPFEGTKTQKVVSEADNLPSIDELLASKLRPSTE